MISPVADAGTSSVSMRERISALMRLRRCVSTWADQRARSPASSHRADTSRIGPDTSSASTDWPRQTQHSCRCPGATAPTALATRAPKPGTNADGLVHIVTRPVAARFRPDVSDSAESRHHARCVWRARRVAPDNSKADEHNDCTDPSTRPESLIENHDRQQRGCEGLHESDAHRRRRVEGS